MNAMNEWMLPSLSWENLHIVYLFQAPIMSWVEKLCLFLVIIILLKILSLEQHLWGKTLN